MNGAQDMGGQHGFGAVVPEENEPLFHAPWEARAMALTVAMGATGAWTIDMSRAARESLPPAEYLTKSYYEIWIAGLETLMAERRLLSPLEIETGETADPAVPLPRTLKAADVPAVLARGGPTARSIPEPPRFAVGARVRTRVINPQTHTRLPRYVRGRIGEVVLHHGAHVYPDDGARGFVTAHHLYTVRFAATELWGPDGDPTSSISVDAFEPYLEPAR